MTERHLQRSSNEEVVYFTKKGLQSFGFVAVGITNPVGLSLTDYFTCNFHNLFLVFQVQYPEGTRIAPNTGLSRFFSVMLGPGRISGLLPSFSWRRFSGESLFFRIYQFIW